MNKFIDLNKQLNFERLEKFFNFILDRDQKEQKEGKESKEAKM